MRPADEPWGEQPYRGAAPVHPAVSGSTRPPQHRTREETQVDLIVRAYGDKVKRGPATWDKDGVHYLYRAGYLIVADDYVRSVLADVDGSVVENGLISGATLVRVPDAIGALETIRRQYGAGVAAPDHVVSITPGGVGSFCPAKEPEVVPGWSQPDPLPSADHAAGEGVRVVVVDTGLDPEAAATHPWLAGVTGDPDPHMGPGGVLGPYAGHGTFIAGVVRSMAPRAEVIVRNVFTVEGSVLETELVKALDRVLANDHPDIISMSAGTWTYDATGLLGFGAFAEQRLTRHKGVVLVTAAGNDGDRRPFWPAAAPWTVSVGALAANWRDRAGFSNHGGWVDVYAPGEDLINAFPVGTFQYHEPPLPRPDGHFQGMARWSGTSFSTPMMAGMIAARMSKTGENGTTAAAALLAQARAAFQPGVGGVLLPA